MFSLIFALAMPSLHKRSRSPFWVAAFCAGDGRRLKKSTKTNDRSLAMKLALEWEQAAKTGRAGRLVESQCRRVLSEIHEHANGEPLHFHTASAWLNEWLAGKKGVTTERTFLKYSQIVAEFINHAGERANAPLGAISPRDLRSFRDSLARAGHSPVTVNGALKILSSPFNAALRLGYIPMNPCAGVEPLRDDADVEKDVFTQEQVSQLIAAAEGDWKGAILAGFYSGLRLRDVTELRWEAVDFKTGMMRVKTRKTGAVIVLPLHPELAAWLGQQTRGIGKAPVFPDLAGRTGGGKSGLSMKFRGIMERAGVVGRILRQREEKSAGRTQSSLSFHSLRHSFNSALANAGVAQELRQKLTGHASKAMNAKYTHHELDALRAAVAVLPSVGRAG
jgi:integrase